DECGGHTRRHRAMALHDARCGVVPAVAVGIGRCVEVPAAEAAAATTPGADGTHQHALSVLDPQRVAVHLAEDVLVRVIARPPGNLHRQRRSRPAARSSMSAVRLRSLRPVLIVRLADGASSAETTRNREGSATGTAPARSWARKAISDAASVGVMW